MDFQTLRDNLIEVIAPLLPEDEKQTKKIIQKVDKLAIVFFPEEIPKCECCGSHVKPEQEADKNPEAKKSKKEKPAKLTEEEKQELKKQKLYSSFDDGSIFKPENEKKLNSLTIKNILEVADHFSIELPEDVEDKKKYKKQDIINLITAEFLKLLIEKREANAEPPRKPSSPRVDDAPVENMEPHPVFDPESKKEDAENWGDCEARATEWSDYEVRTTKGSDEPKKEEPKEQPKEVKKRSAKLPRRQVLRE